MSTVKKGWLQLSKTYIPIEQREVKSITKNREQKPQKGKNIKKAKKARKVPPEYDIHTVYKTVPKDMRAYFYTMQHKEKETFKLLLHIGNGDLILGYERHKKKLQNTRQEAHSILRALQKNRKLTSASKELGLNKDTLFGCLTKWNRNSHIEKRSHITACMIVKYYKGHEYAK